MKFEKIVTEGCILVCGEEEVLTKLAIDTLLIHGCNHLYFIKPPKKIIEYLNDITGISKFSTIPSIENFSSGKKISKSLILCGLKPVHPLERKTFQYIENLFENVYIFFKNDISVFKTYWERQIKRIDIYQYTFSEFIEKTCSGIEQQSSILESKQDVFFTNRCEELAKHEKFINNNLLRCCSIIGLSGIGKKAFMRKLRIDQDLSENCFEFTFIDKNDSIDFLVSGLIKIFGMKFDKKNIKDISPQYQNKNTPNLYRSIFKEFDKKDNARLVFNNFHVIFDNNKQRFFQKDVAVFFHYLLNRKSYKGNKIYILSNEFFDFNNINDREINLEVYLDLMESEEIKLIIENEFLCIPNYQLASAFMKYDSDVIDDLLNGHPEIAKLFVGACRNYPMDRIVSDPNFRNKFDKSKVEYLMDKINLKEDERQLLFYLALFSEEFSIDAILFNSHGSESLIEVLCNKLVIQKHDFLDGSCNYYVPSIIKDYAVSQMPESIAKENHNIIAQYYWNQEDENMTTPSESLLHYRLSLYHFEKAENKSKLSLLVFRFKGIFLNIANELYSQRNWSNALIYFELILNHSKLEDFECVDLTKYLNCKSKYNKYEADVLFEKSTKKCGYHYFFLASYANHLVRMSRFNEAEYYCYKSLKKNGYSVDANGAYPRIIAHLEGSNNAVTWARERLIFLKNKRRTRPILVKILNKSIYSNLLYKNVIKQAFYDTIIFLKMTEIFVTNSLNFSVKIPRSDISHTVAYFKKANQHLEGKHHLNGYDIYPADSFDFISTYVCYLLEHELIKEAEDILSLEENSHYRKEEIQDDEWNNIINYCETNCKYSEDWLKNLPNRYPDINLNLDDQITYYTIIFNIEKMLAHCNKIMKESEKALTNIIKIENMQISNAKISWLLISQYNFLAGIIFLKKRRKPQDFSILYALARLLSRYEKLIYIRGIFEKCWENNIISKNYITSDENTFDRNSSITIQFIENIAGDKFSNISDSDIVNRSKINDNK